MTDLSKFIAPKSDQLNADDLIGGPVTITVTKVSADPSSAEQPISINFDGDMGKPFKPCKSMRRVLVYVWGKDGNSYVGKRMTLYRDPKVTFGGVQVGGIRISHMSGIEKRVGMALTVTRASRKPYTVDPLPDDAPKMDVPSVVEAAKAAAAKGTEAFRAWWKANPDKRSAVKPILSELQRAAEAASATDDGDPFAEPTDEPDPYPTAEEMEAAERAAMDAASRYPEED